MLYTVGEISKLLGIPSSTLRYYDKEGLLPFVERSSGGIRMFQEKDFEWLKIIECMKKTGMPIKDIKNYIELTLQGDDTIPERLAFFQKQRRQLQIQLESLQQAMEVLDYKCWYYETAQEAGTVDALKNMSISEIPEKYHAVRNRLSNIPQIPNESDAE
ncbi:MerR family transcriptional regulator [Lachnospiraceae bacterium SGI.085]